MLTNIRPIANTTLFEVVTGLRRETGNHFRLLSVLTAGLLIPVVLVLLAITSGIAASNLENRRLVSAFVANPDMNTDSLRQSIMRIPGIEQINVLPATEAAPAVLEITPVTSLSVDDIDGLAGEIRSTGAFSFINLDDMLLQRNSNNSIKAKNLGLMLLLTAVVLSALICMIVIKREIFRSNGSTINLKRQLGATVAAITRPYVLRAAVLTAIAVSLAAGLVTVFYKLLLQYVDILSYSGILLNSLPVWHLLILAIISIGAASFAAATALQSSLNVINHILKRITGRILLN